MIIGGSFVTAKPQPNDFDCILVLDPFILGHDLPPTEYNLVSIDAARRLFGGDVFPIVDRTPILSEYVEFFQFTRGRERVGIVEIDI
jgi:hypothetical protein